MPNPASELNQEHGINFYTYYKDDTPLQVIDPTELQQCKKNLEDYIHITQSKVYVFVGSQLVYKHLGIKKSQGFIMEKTFPYSPNKSKFYVVPNTRKANRRQTQASFTRYVFYFSIPLFLLINTCTKI